MRGIVKSKEGGMERLTLAVMVKIVAGEKEKEFVTLWLRLRMWMSRSFWCVRRKKSVAWAAQVVKHK
jgi:hypothetical protein